MIPDIGQKVRNKMKVNKHIYIWERTEILYDSIKSSPAVFFGRHFRTRYFDLQSFKSFQIFVVQAKRGTLSPFELSAYKIYKTDSS